MVNITRSIESYDSVFGMDQPIHLTVIDKPFNNELSSSESIRILNELLMEYNVDDSSLYIRSSENVILDFFENLMYLIGKIIKGIRNFFAKIFGYKTYNDKINEIQRELANKKSANRQELISRIKNSLYEDFGKIYTRSTKDNPIFPNLSKFDTSHIDRKIKKLMNECDGVFKYLSTAGWGRKVPDIDTNKLLPLKNLCKVLDDFEGIGKRYTPDEAGMFICACEFDRFGMWEYFTDDRADDIIKYYVRDFDNVKDKLRAWSNDMYAHLNYWRNTLSNIRTEIDKNRSEIDKRKNDEQIRIIQQSTSELIRAIHKLTSSQIRFTSVLIIASIAIGSSNNTAQYLDDAAESKARHYTAYHKHRVV